MEQPNNFTFREEDHSYWLDGRRLISVTQALSILDDRGHIDPWYKERGRLIHLATELFDRDELDESTIDPRIQGYIDAYVRFITESGFEPNIIEKFLYHPTHLYAGRIDRIGVLNSWQTLIDIKSGAPARVDELQAVAYSELCRANNLSVRKQFDLYLHENGTYKLEPVDRPRVLLPVFLAALTVTRWKEVSR